jgi:hypothetical protein
MSGRKQVTTTSETVAGEVRDRTGRAEGACVLVRSPPYERKDPVVRRYRASQNLATAIRHLEDS